MGLYILGNKYDQQPLVTSTQSALRQHSNTQTTLKQHSNNTQPALSQHSASIQSAFSQHSVSTQSALSTQPALSQHSVSTQSALSQHSISTQSALSNPPPVILVSSGFMSRYEPEFPLNSSPRPYSSVPGWAHCAPFVSYVSAGTQS